jgi:isoleucyl-tRNA synthetase
MRKEAGFEVMDRIKVYAQDNEKIASVLTANKEKIAGIVLADDIVIGESTGYVKEWKINSEKVVLGVEKQ